MKKKVLLSSIAVIALCLCLIAGSTYALFTEQTEVNIAVVAGDLDVTAEIVSNSEKYRSLGESAFKSMSELEADNVRTTAFANGGSASVGTDGVISISQMTPGDAVSFDVKVVNTGDVAVAYTVRHVATAEDKEGNTIASPLTISVTPAGSTNSFTGTNTYVELGSNQDEAEFTVTVEFPNGTTADDNAYQGATMSVQFTVEIVQANGVNTDGTLILPNN